MKTFLQKKMNKYFLHMKKYFFIFFAGKFFGVLMVKWLERPTLIFFNGSGFKSRFGHRNFSSIFHHFCKFGTIRTLIWRKHFPLSSVLTTDLLNSALPWDACLRVWMFEWMRLSFESGMLLGLGTFGRGTFGRNFLEKGNNCSYKNLIRYFFSNVRAAKCTFPMLLRPVLAWYGRGEEEGVCPLLSIILVFPLKYPRVLKTDPGVHWFIG